MAQPTSRTEFKEYCLRKLGKPVIEINVDQDQVEDRIDEALANGTLSCAAVTHTTGDLSIGTGYNLACSGTYTFTAGTITINNGVTLSVGLFSSSTFNTRSIAFGSGGSITLTGNNGTIWSMGTITGFTSTGTSAVNASYSGSVGTRAISAGTLTEGNALTFNITAGTDIVTLNGSVSTINFTGFTGTFGVTGGIATVYGDFTIPATVTNSATGGSNLQFAKSGSGNTQTFTSSGIGPVTFGVAIEGTAQVLLGSNLTSTGSLILQNTGIFNINAKTVNVGSLVLSSRNVTFAVTGGTINCTGITQNIGNFVVNSSYNIVCPGQYNLITGTLTLDADLSIGSFTSSGSGVRSIAFGTGRLLITSTGTVWDTTTLTNFTYTGTPAIIITSTGSTTITVLSGVATETQALNFAFTGGTYVLNFLNTSTHSAKDIDFTGFSGTLATTSGAIIYGNFTLSPTMTLTTTTNTMTFGSTSIGKTITTAGKIIDFPITFNGVGGSWTLQDALTLGTTRTCTLTNGTLGLNNKTLTTGLFQSTNSNTRTLAFGTGNIAVTGVGAVWNTATISGLSVTGTPIVNITNNGSTAISVSTGALSEANSISFNFTAGTYSLTFLDVSAVTVRSIDFTGFSGTWNATNVVKVYGNLKLSPTMTLTATTNTMTFASTSTGKTITTSGKTIDFPITFNGVSGSWILQDDFIIGSTRTLTLANGALDLNGKTLNAGTSFTTASGTKNVTFNGGTIVCPAVTTTAFNNAQPTGFTTTAGSAPGTISLTGATAKTFVGGGSNFASTLIQAGTGALTITGSNTLNDISNTVQPTSILFTAGTTTTLSNLSLGGTMGNLTTIGSATAAQHTLSKSSGTVTLSNCSISYSNVTGGATWRAPSNQGNVDGGNNTGWIFTAIGAVATAIGNFFAFF